MAAPFNAGSDVLLISMAGCLLTFVVGKTKEILALECLEVNGFYKEDNNA